ncbi:MAG TPA: hypothetical protein VJ891_00810, partial [Casimicrobiaceae bacterium]|nr:hypothetical protein [Casimicrobiaceae bacterium]
MAKATWGLVLRTACFGIALLALGGTADAGSIYRGTLDPVFYNGFAEIDVGTDCIRTGPGTFFVQPGIDCSDPVDFLDASVTITDPHTPS